MASLKKLMKKKGYEMIKLTLTSSNHLEVKAKINGVEGSFILDTGASGTCVGLDTVSHFNLKTQMSDMRAAGAGSTNLLTEMSEENSIELKNWGVLDLHLILFDLTHVNEALVKQKANPVHGIIGADILRTGEAVIDYKRRRLYLR